MSSENPISPKVVASSIGAGVGATVSTLLNWLLGVLVWHAPATAAAVGEAVAAVPSPVSAIVVLLVTTVSAGGAGYKVTDPLRVTPKEKDQLDSQAGR